MRILNFGSLNLDHVYTLDHLVRPGETLLADSCSVYFGGKGHNQSVALAKAGAPVWHAGFIGPDGAAMKDGLEKMGVDVRFLNITDAPSGHAVIQVDREGQNSIIVYPGANWHIDEAYADEVLGNFGPGDFILLQNEISCVPHIMSQAREKGLRIILNPSPYNESIDSLPLHFVSLFIVNEVEGAALSGESEPEEICKSVLKKYPESSILLTLGGRGCVYHTGGEFFSQPSVPVEAVDTTAAGDTFTGYFLSYTINGAPAQEALLAASVAASIAISRPGASDSIPDKPEVEEKLSALR